MGAAAEAIRAQGFRLPDRDWLIWASQARQSCPARVDYYSEQPWHRFIVTTSQSGYEASTSRDEVGMVTPEDDYRAAQIGRWVDSLAKATDRGAELAWALRVRWRASRDVVSIARVCRQYAVRRQEVYEMANEARHWVEANVRY